MSHSKEPWIADDSESTAIKAVSGNGLFWVADFAGSPGMIDESGADNRDRAIACVNSCAGMTTRDVTYFASTGGFTRVLEEKTMFSKLFAKYEKQSTELMAAIDNLLKVKGRHNTEIAYKRLAAVFAKVNGDHLRDLTKMTDTTTAPAIIFYPAGSLGEEVAP